MSGYYCVDCGDYNDIEHFCKYCNGCLETEDIGCETCHVCTGRECLIGCVICGTCIECLEQPIKYCTECKCCSNCYPTWSNCCNRCKACNPDAGNCEICQTCDKCYKTCITCESCLTCTGKDSKYPEYCSRCIKTCEVCSSRYNDVCYTCCDQAVEALPYVGRITKIRNPSLIQRAVAKQLGFYIDHTQCLMFEEYEDLRLFCDMAVALPKCFQNSLELVKYRDYVIRENIIELKQLITREYISQLKHV